MDAAAMLDVLTKQSEMLKLMAEKLQESDKKVEIAKIPGINQA